ncbi:hypothetical protein ACI65C_009130 [Semiaphis heraclei]
MSTEDDKRLSAYLEFLTIPTELSRIEEENDQDDHDKSSDDVDEFEIYDRAFTTIENVSNNNSLYKSIKVQDVKELSSIKFKLLTKGRQRLHDKNLKREIYWATMEKRADDENMSATKLETLSFKDVWEDLVQMKSTKKFCKYLTDSPNLAKPKYLVDAGLFNNVQNVKKPKKKPASSHRTHTRLFFPNL